MRIGYSREQQSPACVDRAFFWSVATRICHLITVREAPLVPSESDAEGLTA